MRKVALGRTFERLSEAEALKIVRLYTEAGCPVSITRNPNGTYTVRTYQWRTPQ